MSALKNPPLMKGEIKMNNRSELREQTLEAVTKSGHPFIQDRVRLGLLIMTSFFGAMIIWSVFAPLSTGAVATGQVVVDGLTISLQHLEGGIIKNVAVQNGAKVVEGDTIVEFSDISALADKKFAATQMLSLKARRERLLAEKNNSANLVFPLFDYPSIPTPAHEDILELEKALFLSRKNVFAKEDSALISQVKSSERILHNSQSQLARVVEQLSLILKEIKDTSGLLEKGFATQSRVLALKRQRETYEGEKFRLMSQISNAEVQMENAEVSHRKFQAEFNDSITIQLQELSVNSRQITGLLAIADDKLERTKIRAPRAGIIMNMQVTKKGEVVSAGSTLASLVPETTHLIISARLNPADSASIAQGLNARITIMAFNSRTAPTLEGIVTYVSPDVVTDENTGLPYYPVHVELTDTALAQLGNDTLQPGMPAQVVITTAKRPIIGYLLDPIMQTVRNAFHEK